MGPNQLQATSRGSLGSTASTRRRYMPVPPPENNIIAQFGNPAPTGEPAAVNPGEQEVFQRGEPTAVNGDAAPSTLENRLEPDANLSSASKTLINVGMFITCKKINKEIKKAVSSLYSGDWACYGRVPKEVRDRMYELFMRRYELPPDELLYGKPFFKRIASKWVREQFIAARRSNQHPPWVTQTAWDSLKTYWATETYKERRRLNKKNATGPNRLTWRGGSKGMQQHVDDEVKKTGVKPKKIKMFKKLWGKKDGTMPEGRASTIVEAVSKAAEQAAESGVDFHEDLAFQ